MNTTVPARNELVEMIIEDVLTQWPETAVVFQAHKMACPGCAVAGFYTIADAAHIYNLAADQFVDDLLAAINQSPS